jgi:hypothetical protein
MKRIFNLCLLLLLTGCSSFGSRDSSPSREVFLKELGPMMTEGRAWFGNKEPESGEDFLKAGLCKDVFEGGLKLSLPISRGEVASCLYPFLSFQSVGSTSSGFKDLPDSSPYKASVSFFEKQGLLSADSEFFFGVHRPIKVRELEQIIETLKERRL